MSAHDLSRDRPATPRATPPRRVLRDEVLLVLGLSLAASALYALVSLLSAPLRGVEAPLFADVGLVYQLLNIGFPPGANFEGRIADELAKLANDRTIRVLDLLFVARDTDYDELVVLEHQEESMGSVVGALLGLTLDDAVSDEHSFGFTQAEIEEMGQGLAPGGSAGLLLIEHVWARDLKRAIRDAGGTPFSGDFLTPETVAAMEPKLAAMAGRTD